jgi:hypothetical protein
MASIVWIMAMYTIIHVDKSWIVCSVQGKQFIFDRKSLALKTVHDAKELLHGDETSKRKPTTVCSEGERDLSDDLIEISRFFFSWCFDL